MKQAVATDKAQSAKGLLSQVIGASIEVSAIAMATS